MGFVGSVGVVFEDVPEIAFVDAPVADVSATESILAAHGEHRDPGP